MRKAFGRRESGRAGCVGQEGVVTVEFVAHTQISNLDEAVVGCTKQIGRLDVPMNDLLVVN